MCTVCQNLVSWGLVNSSQGACDDATCSLNIPAVSFCFDQCYQLVYALLLFLPETKLVSGLCFQHGNHSGFAPWRMNNKHQPIVLQHSWLLTTSLTTSACRRHFVQHLGAVLTWWQPNVCQTATVHTGGEEQLGGEQRRRGTTSWTP